MKKKIAIIGSMGIPAKYGGFETLSEQLCLHLADRFDITVYCSSIAYPKQQRKNTPIKVNRIFIPFKANGLSSIPYDILSLLHAAINHQTILVLGGSSTFILPFFRLIFFRKEIIFHPDGLEWKRKKWNLIAKWFLFISIKIGIRFSNKIILDNLQLGKHHSSSAYKSVYIPYGGDNYNLPGTKTKKFWLTIARAENENNLLLIANAFKVLENEQWILLSNWKNTPFGRFLEKEFGHRGNITFLNATYNNNDLEQLYSESKGYIHGHSKGGTNPTLVAAMWQEVPLFCHKNNFNIETTNSKAQYFSTTSELIALIKNQDKPNSELKEFAKKHYKWEQICNAYAELFSTP